MSAMLSGDWRDTHRAAMPIKCQARDLLSMMGVLQLYAQTILLPMGTNNSSCEALLSCIEVAQLAIATSRTNVRPERLLGVAHRFQQNFTSAFGFKWLTPKCHWLLHLPETLKSHGRLLNCFVLERKRRVPKRYATELANTSGSASKSLLSECVAHHLSSLNRHSFNYEVGLVDGRTAPRKKQAIVFGRAAVGWRCGFSSHGQGCTIQPPRLVSSKRCCASEGRRRRQGRPRAAALHRG